MCLWRRLLNRIEALLRLLTAGLVPFSAAFVSPAAGAEPQPGYYTGSGGDDTLTITRQPDGTLTFHAFALGGNDSSCDIEGEIHAGIGKASEVGMTGSCDFKFSRRGATLTISAPDACYQICMRGDIRASYKKTDPYCTYNSFFAKESRFNDLYKAEQFKEAFELISNLLSKCRGTQLEYHQVEAFNMLGRAQHALHDDSGCRKTLAPFVDLAKMTDSDFDEFQPMIRDDKMANAYDTRATLILCGMDAALFPKDEPESGDAKPSQ